MPAPDVQHQDRALEHIARALRSGRLAHAFLFCGPEGVGRERTARRLAQCLLCSGGGSTAPGGESPPAAFLAPCETCPDCHLCEVDTHPDLRVIHRFLNRFHEDSRIRSLKATEISVEVIRSFLIDEAGHKAARGRAKVFIVREAHRLSRGAENALLKTLEEPPDDTFIVLIAPSAEDLLPTIRSRCAVIEFDALPRAFVEAQLAARRGDVPEAQRAWLARFSAGSLGRALELADEGAYELNEAFIRGWIGAAQEAPLLAWALWQKSAEALAAHYRKRDEELSDGEALRQGLAALLSMSAAWFADALRIRTGGGALLNEQAGDALQRWAADFDERTLCGVMDRLHRAAVHLDMNVNTQLAVEGAMFDVHAALRGQLAGC